MAVVISGALVLSACVASPEPEASPVEPEASPVEEARPVYDKPVDLTLTTWASNTAFHDIWQELAAEFREENPEMGELTIQVIPVGEYVATMAIQLQSGDAPDLGWIRDNDAAAWLDSGALWDLSYLKTDPEFDFDDVLPNLVNRFEGADGELWAYPAVSTVHPVYFNKEVFAAAGVDSPRDLYERGDWNWQNLRKIAKEVVDAGAVSYGFDLPSFSFSGLPSTPYYIHRAFGASYWPGGNTCGLADPSSVEATEFLRGMVFDDKSFKTPGTTPNFLSGDTAMTITAPSFMNQMKEAPFEWDMVPQPKGKGTYNPVLGQASLVVWNKGEAPELATRLLGYLAGPRGAVAQAGVFLPARSRDLDAARAVMIAANPLVTAESIQTSVFDPISASTLDEVPVRLPEISSAINPILDGLWVPEADVSSLLQEACTIAEPLLR